MLQTFLVFFEELLKEFKIIYFKVNLKFLILIITNRFELQNKAKAKSIKQLSFKFYKLSKYHVQMCHKSP